MTVEQVEIGNHEVLGKREIFGKISFDALLKMVAKQGCITIVDNDKWSLFETSPMKAYMTI